MTSTTRSREWIRELAVAETRGPVAPVWSVCRSYMEWSHRPVLHVVLVVWIPVVSALDRTGL